MFGQVERLIDMSPKKYCENDIIILVPLIRCKMGPFWGLIFHENTSILTWSRIVLGPLILYLNCAYDLAFTNFLPRYPIPLAVRNSCVVKQKRISSSSWINSCVTNGQYLRSTNPTTGKPPINKSTNILKWKIFLQQKLCKHHA